MLGRESVLEEVTLEPDCVWSRAWADNGVVAVTVARPAVERKVRRFMLGEALDGLRDDGAGFAIQGVVRLHGGK